MRDGSFVQVGTPEQIVSAPVDEYVADFVRGMPLIKILRAEHIMQALGAPDVPRIAAADGPLQRAHLTTGLEMLVELMIRSPRPILIEADSHQPVGVVTLPSLLRAIKVGPEPSAAGPVT